MEGIGQKDCKVPNQKCVSSPYYDHSSSVTVDSGQIASFDDFLRPVNGIQNSGPWYFEFAVQNNFFLQMQQLELEIKFRVYKGEKQKLDATDSVALINNFGNSMFKQVECKLNSQDFHGNTAANSGYKAYIENVLSYEKCALETHAIVQGFHLDSPAKMDSCDDTNAGFTKRKEMIALSRVCDIYTTICSDFLRSSNFLVAGNMLSIRLTKHSDSFLLMTSAQNPTYYIHIEDMKLYYRRSQLVPAQANQIIGKDERYISKKTELMTFPLGDGLQTKSINLVTGNVLPKSVVVGMVLTEACEGKYSLNPWNFQAFDLNEIYLKSNGKSYPANPLKPDFKNKNYAREFAWLYGEVGCFTPDRGLCITPDMFNDGGGFTLFPFDLR